MLLAALAVFGARVHWVEEAGTAERDGYVAKAETLLAGEVPRDPFRPLLYPLLTAGLAGLGLPPFTAARTLSNLAAVALVLAAWGFGRRLGGPRLAAWAAAATALNPNLWILGQHTTTDMLFAALAAAALLAALAYLERPRPGTAVLAGLAFGAAAFTRGNAAFLLPALLAAWVLAGSAAAGAGERGAARERGAGGERHPWRVHIGHLLVSAGVASVVLIPHWLLRSAVFGNPFHDENWKNLAWKLYGYPDWSYLDRVPVGGLWEVVASDPMAVLHGAISELLRFASSGLSQLLGTPLHALAFVAGAWVALRFRRRQAGFLLGAAGVFIVALAAVFFTWGRLLMALLPIANALAFAPFAEPGEGLRQDRARRLAVPSIISKWLPLAASVVAVGLVLLLGVKTFVFRLPAFIERHPYREVELLRRLDRELPAGAVLAGTSPFLGRYLERPYLALPDAFGDEIERPELYFAKLRPSLVETDARYLVVGEIDLRDRPPSLVGREPPVPWLALEERREGVTVWRVVR